MRRSYTFSDRNLAKRRHRPRAKFYILISLFLAFDLFYFFNVYHHNPADTAADFNYTTYQKEANAALAQNNGANFAMLPLLLQNNPAWATATYGNDDSTNTVRDNGCAILSLAMVTSFWEKKTVSPATILNWSKNNYYVPQQGTSWQIFPDYAAAKGWKCDNLGANWNVAQQTMARGIPLIVSMKPGTFTTTGHIMVITSTNGKIHAYDPNDNPQKRHAFTAYLPTTFQNEAANYWAIHL